MQELYAAEFRRCLLMGDVGAIRKIWEKVAPHLCNGTPADDLITLHIARCDAISIPAKLKSYSKSLLAERGIRKIAGKWTAGLPKKTTVSEAVGIASHSNDPKFSRKIVRAMEDALLNGLEKGVTEPPKQRELMLKAREKIRFKAARI